MTMVSPKDLPFQQKKIRVLRSTLARDIQFWVWVVKSNFRIICMEKVVKNAFLADFGLNFTFLSKFWAWGFSRPSKTLFWPKNSKRSPKIFLSALLYEMFPLCVALPLSFSYGNLMCEFCISKLCDCFFPNICQTQIKWKILEKAPLNWPCKSIINWSSTNQISSSNPPNII